MTKNSLNQLTFNNIRVNSLNDIKENFISLPGSVVQTLETTGIPVQEFGIAVVQNGKKIVHVGWNGYESQGYLNGQMSIDMNPILAKEANLIPETQVTLKVSRFDQSQIAKEVFVEPLTSDDWEIIESHAMFFQDEILHQTRIVTMDEILICYIDNVVSKFRVKNIIPNNLRCARINTGSLIVVSPRENHRRLQKSTAKSEFRKQSAVANKEIGTTFSVFRRSFLSKGYKNSRGMKVWLNSTDSKSKFAFVSLIQNSIEFKKHPKHEKNFRYATKIAVEVFSKDLPKEHIEMSSSVWTALNTYPVNGSRINIEFFSDDHSVTSNVSSKVIVRPFLDDKEYSKRSEQQSITDQYTLKETIPADITSLMHSLNQSVLTNKMIHPIQKICVEILDDATGRHLPFTRFDVTSTNWKYMENDIVKLTIPEMAQEDEENFVEKSLNMNFLHGADIIKDLRRFLAIPSTPSNCVVVEGNPGMGKTSILRELIDSQVFGEHKYVKYIDCESLMESSNLGKMKQILQDCCSICYWHYPSTLLIDNAESLFPTVKSEDPQQLEMLQKGGATSTRLALFFIDIIQEISKKNPCAIKVVMTTTNRSSLNNAFFDKHFIADTIKRRPPDIEERTRLLEFFIHNYHTTMSLTEDIEFRDIAIETEGYSPLDLRNLTEKLFYEITMRTTLDESALELDKNTFLQVLKSFTPSALRGVKLTKSTGVSWKDIGALEGPKQLLLETLEWPTKYAPIFKNAPLQLRSGILLYGYPGCGKTLLASAVAQQCGLNFITVKGPEVINKYIGASEQNIRELFERAQSVKPCILFFDEFDSIAPKRGHDSTGVTDRIVNQLLTQMDGVEGLDGVYVLAATSRPDLIDSALLRPGRIDRSVLCNIPDENDRYLILNAVSAKMKMQQGADLRLIASLTNGYSGADLQGLCYSAYLIAIHRHTLQLKKTSERENSNGDDLQPLKTHIITEDQIDFPIEYMVLNHDQPTPSNESSLQRIIQELKNDPTITLSADSLTSPKKQSPEIVITPQDLIDACKETKPSISPTEFQKLQSIYNIFKQDREGNMSNADDNPNDVGTRTSLM